MIVLGSYHYMTLVNISYLLPVWGGCEGYLLKSLQVLQNRAARQVTKLSWYTPIRRLLKHCNWLSINQLVFYHSALTVHRTIKSGLPEYLHQHLSTDHPLPTRLGDSGTIRLTGRHDSLVENSFREHEELLTRSFWTSEVV